MNIIPVIDLLNGQVVHARMGDRQHYLPIQSSLCTGSEPLAMVEALLQLYPFTKLYIADLNAIQQSGNHNDVVEKIAAHFPQLEIWLDAGFNSTKALQPWQGSQILPVLGTESLVDIAQYQILSDSSKEAYVLSLDFKNQHYQGPQELLTNNDFWPSQVICMTLSQVGSNAGPDWQQLQQLKAINNGKHLYAAGGIRHLHDLQQLQQIGISGALIATALHNGSIGRKELERLHTEKLLSI